MKGDINLLDILGCLLGHRCQPNVYFSLARDQSKYN